MQQLELFQHKQDIQQRRIQTVQRLFRELPYYENVCTGLENPTPKTPQDKNDVFSILATLQDEFSKKLTTQCLTKHWLSPKQWWHAIKKAGQSVSHQKIELNFIAIIQLFDKSLTNGLKHPKINLKTQNGDIIVLKLTGNKTRDTENIGTITVTDDGKYPYNKWFGRILKNGTFQQSKLCSPEIVNLLIEFSNNPTQIAAKYGKLTGNCSFCSRQLSDIRSTTVGYGAICARNYGLQWGINL